LELFNDIYKGKRIFITGVTGFKGSWLTLWLLKLGAIVKGYSLYPFKKECHFNLLDLGKYKNFENEYGDIRYYKKLQKSIENFKPDIVIHLSAQAIVKIGYQYPLYTIETNTIGTANILDICRYVDSIKSILIITTDKVYKDDNRNYNYSETDSLGGDDPYSASKACCEILIDSYRKSYYKEKDILLASARGGNVIGGGDFSDYRIIPDMIRAKISDTEIFLRNPNQIRPWQYVLDCLTGYLLLGQKLLEKNNQFATAYNFGANNSDSISVEELINKVDKYWPLRYQISQEYQEKETEVLKLNSFKARSELNWKSVYDIDKTLKETIKWYREYYKNNKIITEKQIEEYGGVLKGVS
jgi:CDP-glucose 4,6-dehydratase